MERKSNIELLRILAMLCIVGVHYLSGSNAIDNIVGGEHNIAYIILETILGAGVNIFVLITGYFMIEKREICIRKILKLLFDIAFYGLSIFIITLIIGINQISALGMIKSVVPILFGYRWFVKAWMICYIFIPFINKTLISLNRKEFQILIIIMVILFSIWPFFIPNPPLDDYGYSFWHFIFIYVIAAYIRRFPINIKIRNTVIILLFSWISTIVISFLGNSNMLILKNMYGYKWALNSPFMILSSCMIFILFQNIKIKNYNKLINKLAKSAFAVFLIHGDFNIMEYLFKNICKADRMYATYMWVPYMFICISIIYFICFLVDLIKIHSVDIVINYIFNKIKICNYRIEV